jgi:hypothetical protein
MEDGEIIERDGFRFKVKIEPDDDTMLSDFGKYQDRCEQYVIDRKAGIFLGPEMDEPFVAKMEALGIEDYEEQSPEKSREDGWWEGHKILAENLTQNCERGTYQYFKPENFDVNKDGTIDPEQIKYAIQNYERAEDYGNGWSYISVGVALLDDDDEEVETEWLGNIESDQNDYIEEVVEEHIETHLKRLADEAKNKADKGQCRLELVK